MQAATLKVDAWKAYTGAPPKGFEHGWFVDDEKIAYPMLEQARKLGVRRFCVHKGLPLGPVADYNHPRDLIKAAKDFPDIDFLRLPLRAARAWRRSQAAGEVPWTTEFCQMKKKEPGITNIYMELGSTFGQLVTTNPTACAHLLGQIIDAFGADHVLWGTDSIWYGTPQWQIDAFRRFEIPAGAGREARVRAAHARGEGADLRAERGAGLRRRRERQAQRDPQGLPQPDQDGVSRRRAGAEPPLVRMGHEITGAPPRAGVVRATVLRTAGRSSGPLLTWLGRHSGCDRSMPNRYNLSHVAHSMRGVGHPSLSHEYVGKTTFHRI